MTIIYTIYTGLSFSLVTIRKNTYIKENTNIFKCTAINNLPNEYIFYLEHIFIYSVQQQIPYYQGTLKNFTFWGKVSQRLRVIQKSCENRGKKNQLSTDKTGF